MTQRDRWAKRKCVTKFWSLADLIRKCVAEQVGSVPPADSVMSFSWVAYFEPPESYSDKKRRAMIGTRHRVKPDKDNVEKGLLDVLYKGDDQKISDGSSSKRWGEKSQVVITIEYEEQTDVDSRPGGTAPTHEGPRKAEVRPRLGSPRARRGTRHEPVPVEHLCV